MQINLQQTEIEEALVQYVSNHGIDVANKDIDVTFKPSRKNAQGENVNGFTASVNLTLKPAIVTDIAINRGEEGAPAPDTNKTIFGTP